MTGSNLARFGDRSERHGQQLQWNRVDRDGAPFLGHMPLVTEEEYEERAVRTRIPDNGHFDTTDPERNRAYLEILEAIVNGWYELLYIDRERAPVIYIEWVEYYMTDGTPSRSPPRMGPMGGVAAPPPG